MTPKEAYEERKTIRKASMGKVISNHDKKEIEMFEIMDRFATAFERIADVLERR